MEEKSKVIMPVPAAETPVAEEKPRQDKSYNPQTIEKKWQDKWEADKLYRSVIDNSKPKHYALTMLPYPSGDLHIGHWFSMTPSGYTRTLHADEGLQRIVPDGLRCFRSACRECGHQRRYPPYEADVPEH